MFLLVFRALIIVPCRGNLLMTPDKKLAFIDFGMMADVSEEDRYGLVGLVIGLQNKDLPLVTENLLKVRNRIQLALSRCMPFH
jgi:predicted unusual protein kinase regulating ubiquinone biosynthesis (AarF/ABC1/UbiB family)